MSVLLHHAAVRQRIAVVGFALMAVAVLALDHYTFGHDASDWGSAFDQQWRIVPRYPWQTWVTLALAGTLAVGAGVVSLGRRATGIRLLLVELVGFVALNAFYLSRDGLPRFNDVGYGFDFAGAWIVGIALLLRLAVLCIVWRTHIRL